MQRPLLTKATTAAILMSISDVACQKIEHTIKPEAPTKQPNTNPYETADQRILAISSHQLFSNDWKRTTHIAITGFTWTGPISHVWYGILEAVVKIRFAPLGLLVRLSMDAFLFSPVAVAGYFTWRAALEGLGFAGIAERLQAKWQSTLVASWEFWTLVNAINFSLIPLPFRVLFNNCFSFFWSAFLSHANNVTAEERKTE